MIEPFVSSVTALSRQSGPLVTGASFMASVAPERYDINKGPIITKIEETAKGQMDSNRALEPLRRERLVAIGFLRDRIRLQFDDAILDLYSAVCFRKDNKTTFPHQPGWRDLLCSCLQQTVSSAYQDADTDLVIAFDDGASIRISLRAKDRTKDRAAHLRVPDRFW